MGLVHGDDPERCYGEGGGSTDSQLTYSVFGFICLFMHIYTNEASYVLLVVKNLPANAEDSGLIPNSGQPPEKEMATHSSVLAWRVPSTEESGGLQSMGP